MSNPRSSFLEHYNLKLFKSMFRRYLSFISSESSIFIFFLTHLIQYVSTSTNSRGRLCREDQTRRAEQPHPHCHQPTFDDPSDSSQAGVIFLTFISVYVPSHVSVDAIKESFYDLVNSIIWTIPASDKLVVLGDFNARIGRDHRTWKSVLGHHAIGNCNTDGYLLLGLCIKRPECHQYPVPILELIRNN